jgi:hypothetical protein
MKGGRASLILGAWSARLSSFLRVAVRGSSMAPRALKMIDHPRFEKQWQDLSERSDLDPVTVAACKHLHDHIVACLKKRKLNGIRSSKRSHHSGSRKDNR